ncbi:hypothetical protein [Acidiphilium sp.]|uniref:hypothetical protein n=1 Tax=Acidiphilium sp. TaxID=527 RepID=UPI003D00FF83
MRYNHPSREIVKLYLAAIRDVDREKWTVIPIGVSGTDTLGNDDRYNRAGKQIPGLREVQLLRSLICPECEEALQKYCTRGMLAWSVNPRLNAGLPTPCFKLAISEK